MTQPLNGAGAIDLESVKAGAAVKAQLDAQRDQLTAQLLRQAGLICACGNPLPSTPTLYYRLEEGPVQTPTGPQLGANLMVHACCSESCPAATELERSAAARRKGQRGQITLLPAGREALARAETQ